ncbi:MAG: hypothetical protein HUJ86_04570 [Synergistes sp.]|nr:hypothetical protein [Synergistes sp.]
MKLKEAVALIMDFAREYPNVHAVHEGDIYDTLNGGQELEYTAVVVTQQQHNYQWQQGYAVLNFNVFYVDRLTADGGNRLDVQSAAADFFASLVAYLDDKAIVEEYTLNTFTERFADLCAGGFLTLGLRVSLPCAEAFKHPSSYCYLISEDGLYIITEDNNYVITKA